MPDPRIWDCCTYFDELDHLAARFEMLDGLVAGHIVVEGTHTHQGDPKPLHLDGVDLPDDVIRCVADLGGYEEPWDREQAQRDYIGQVVREMTALMIFDPDDVLVVCDVDEHLNPAIVDRLADATARGPVGLGMRMLFYGLTWELDTGPMPAWLHGRALRVSDLPRSLSVLRVDPPHQALVGAGWHVSYTGGPERRAAKLRAFAHAEKNTADTHALMATAHETGIGPNGEELVAVTDLDGIPDALVRRFGGIADAHLADKTVPMKIETTVRGLSKAKRNKLEGLVAFDDTNDTATFEWRADQNPPHDYASAYSRVKADVVDAGGEIGEFRILS